LRLRRFYTITHKKSVINMKSINTFLTERQFLNRLEQLPNSKTYLLDKCDESGVYVYNIKDNRFWLGKYARIGRSYGCLSTRLNCKYEIGENSHIVVTYRRAKHIFGAILNCAFVIVGMFFCINSFVNLLREFKYEDLILLLAFLFLGLYGLVIKPHKEWNSLEALLYNICNKK